MITKEEFDLICKKNGLIGANLYFIDGDTELSYQYGYMDKEEQKETKKDTVYRIASISKSVLAIGAMTLIEKGLLDLDEDISTYLGFKVRNPKFPDDAITTRMLMTQTSSITDGFDDEDMTNETRIDGYNGLNGRRLNIPLETVLTDPTSPYYSSLTFDRKKPGTNFIYSNFGCGILACIIEKIVKQNYDDYMQKVLFKPLALDASYYAYNIKHQEMLASIYSSYGKIASTDWPRRAYEKAKIGESYLGVAGGLFISTPELAKIMQSFYKPEYQILKQETLDEMFKVQWTGHVDEYKKKGLQLLILDDLTPFSLYGHFGSAYGLRSFMLFNPYKKTGACFMTNGGTNDNYIDGIPEVHRDIIKALWK